MQRRGPGKTNNSESNRPKARPEICDFLRKSLSAGPVSVAELEEKARAAGLLKPDKRITHAKVFRAAKKELGIRSRREGGPVGGKWIWSIDLPLIEDEPPGPSPPPPLSAEDRSLRQRRAELAKVVAWLCTIPKPAHFS